MRDQETDDAVESADQGTPSRPPQGGVVVELVAKQAVVACVGADFSVSGLVTPAVVGAEPKHSFAVFENR